LGYNHNIEKVFSRTIKELKNEGRLKGKEFIITKVKRPEGNKVPDIFLKEKEIRNLSE